jgi:structural maintenance of chromosomes protein 6
VRENEAAEKDLLAQAVKVDREEAQALREEIARLENDQSFGVSDVEEDSEDEDEDEEMEDTGKGEEDEEGSSSSSSAASSSKQTEKKKKKKSKKKKKTLSLREQLAAISREKQEIGTKITKAKRLHLKAKKMLQTHAAKVDSVRQEAEQQRARVNEFAAAARSIKDDHGKGWQSVLLPGDKSSRKLAAEVKQLTRKVSEAKEKHCNVDVAAVRNRCLKVKKKYKRKKAELDMISDNLDMLIGMGKARRKRFKGLRSHVTKMSSLGFNSMQANFGAAGSLDINHRDRSLKADVVLREGAEVVNNAGQLSGGERSSTTLALLMSLTTAIDTPFTCMDEFDVFMDERNRRISVKTMMDHAMSTKTPDRQYIFIVSLLVFLLVLSFCGARF